MSDDSASLELRTVVQRFNDSSKVLEQLRDRIRSLGEVDNSQSVSAQSLGAASDQLRLYAAQLQDSTSALLVAVETVQSAMTTARDFLRETDLSALRGDFSDLGSTLGSQIAELQSSQGRTIELLEREVASARTEIAEALRARQQLEAKIAAVPEKSRRKLGL